MGLKKKVTTKDIADHVGLSCSGKKIFAFVFCGLAQLAFGIIQSWTLQDIYLDFLDLRDAD